MNFWERMEQIDRRWVYLMVGLAVVIPFVIPANFPISITPEAQMLYDAVEALPDSCTVMVVFDYYPSTIAECEPMARSALHHMWRKDCKVITLSNIPLGGPSMAETVTREIAQEYGKVYGEDFVNLGYKANYVAVLSGMGTSIESIFPTDNSGTPLPEIPMMDSVVNYEQVSFIFEIADNATADYWVSIVNAQYGVPMGCGTTAVSAPKYYAFVGSGQFVGLLGGMKGAAEYEILVDKRAKAVVGMGAQSMVHLLIIALVVLGNVSYFILGKHKRGLTS
ncbi:MAG: hypothetical protein OEV49_13990 [candidate division Zixibacteria bacterium]|nr:hypothetical protein [candidate division Zixibacteria bacterium]MDH3938896.1 hypothetical protein [candidate division Zixibacteria bacterium]MDH4035340.1 hypothetical protein [candidate division Zixibacteria bacterium]